MSIAVSPFPGCSDGDIYYHAQRYELNSWNLGPSPTIVVDLFRGDISIVQSEDEKVTGVIRRLCSTKQSQNAADTALGTLRISTTQEGNTIRITTRSDPTVQAYLGTNLELRVPVDARLDLLTSDGYIFIGNYRGGPNGAYLKRSPVVVRSARARAGGRRGFGDSDTQIKVDIATRPLNKAAPSQAIALDLESRHGSIAIKGDDLLVDARAPGETIVTTIETDQGPNTYETKSAGAIIFSGTLAEGIHSLQASDHIRVRLPKVAKFRVDAGTTGGIVTSDFPVKEEGEKKPTRLIGLVDDEKTVLRLRNRGGSILIEQEP